MAWIDIGAGEHNRPKNNKYEPLIAAAYPTCNTLHIDYTAVALMGNPRRIRVQYDPDAELIRLSPTHPTDKEGFTLSIASAYYRSITVARMLRRHPHMEGRYAVSQCEGGIELCRIRKDSPKWLGLR